MNEAQQIFADPTAPPDANVFKERPNGIVLPGNAEELLKNGEPRLGPDDPNKGGMYRRVNLTDEEKKYVVYTKYEALSTDVSDTQHDKKFPWVDQFTATPGWLQEVAARISVDLGDGQFQMLDTDHSYVVTFWGSPAGEYGIAQDGLILTRVEAEDRMVTTGRRNIPIFTRWDFKMVEAAMTDGFELRRKLVESANQRAKTEQADMFAAFKDFFQQMSAAKGEPQNINQIPSSPQDLAEMLSQFTPEQITAAAAIAQNNSATGTAMDDELTESQHIEEDEVEVVKSTRKRVK
jgi:hypothetical protein